MKRDHGKRLRFPISITAWGVCIGLAVWLTGCTPTDAPRKETAPAPSTVPEAKPTEERGPETPPPAAPEKKTEPKKTTPHAGGMTASAARTEAAPARAAGEKTVTLLYTVNNLGYITTCG